MPEKSARDIMTPDPVTVEPAQPVTEAAQLMVERNVGALPVLSDGKVVGIVTEGDLILQDVRVEFPTYMHLLDGFIMYPPTVARFEHDMKKAATAKVADVMTRDPISVEPETMLSDVATMLVDREISRVLVLEDRALVGIISKHDIVKALAEEDS